jgi:hypothetical protein
MATVREYSALRSPGTSPGAATTAGARARTTAGGPAENAWLEDIATTTIRGAETQHRPLPSRAISTAVFTTAVKKQEQFQSTGTMDHSSSCMSNTTGNDDCLIYECTRVYMYKAYELIHCTDLLHLSMSA